LIKLLPAPLLLLSFIIKSTIVTLFYSIHLLPVSSHFVALHFFLYRFKWEQTFLEICTPKDVEVSSPEVFGSVSEKFARKNYGV